MSKYFSEKEIKGKKKGGYVPYYIDPTFRNHSATQVVRFTKRWDDLDEQRKLQLAFNMGALSMSDDIRKEESYDVLMKLHDGNTDGKDVSTRFMIESISRGWKLDYSKID